MILDLDFRVKLFRLSQVLPNDCQLSFYGALGFDGHFKGREVTHLNLGILNTVVRQSNVRQVLSPFFGHRARLRAGRCSLLILDFLWRPS